METEIVLVDDGAVHKHGAHTSRLPDLTQRVGFVGEYRPEPSQVSFREARGNERPILDELCKLYGDVGDLEFWGRAYVTTTDGGRAVNLFTADELGKLNFVGLPVYIEHCYPSGEKIPSGHSLDPSKYTVPTPDSVPVGRVVASDSSVAQGEVWIKVSLDLSGVAPERAEQIRALLRSGKLGGLSICYALNKDGNPVRTTGSEPDSARFMRKDNTNILLKEVSLVAIPDIHGCRVVLVKASNEGSAIKFAQEMSSTTTTAATSGSAGGAIVEAPSNQGAIPQVIQNIAEGSHPRGSHSPMDVQQPAVASATTPAPTASSADAVARQQFEQLQASMMKVQQQQQQQAQAPAPTPAPTKPQQQQQQTPVDDPKFQEQARKIAELEAKLAGITAESERKAQLAPYVKEASKLTSMPRNHLETILGPMAPEAREKFMDMVRGMAKQAGGQTTNGPTGVPPTTSAPNRSTNAGTGAQRMEPAYATTDLNSKLWAPPASSAPLGGGAAQFARPADQSPSGTGVPQLTPGVTSKDIHPLVERVWNKIPEYTGTLFSDPKFLSLLQETVANSM